MRRDEHARAQPPARPPDTHKANVHFHQYQWCYNICMSRLSMIAYDKWAHTNTSTQKHLNNGNNNSNGSSCQADSHKRIISQFDFSRCSNHLRHHSKCEYCGNWNSWKCLIWNDRLLYSICVHAGFLSYFFLFLRHSTLTHSYFDHSIAKCKRIVQLMNLPQSWSFAVDLIAMYAKCTCC